MKLQESVIKIKGFQVEWQKKNFLKSIIYKF